MIIFAFCVIFSILIGIFTGKLIFNMYKLSSIHYHGPNSSQIKNKILKNKKDNKCYIFEPHIYLCPII